MMTPSTLLRAFFAILNLSARILVIHDVLADKQDNPISKGFILGGKLRLAKSSDQIPDNWTKS